MSDLARYYVSQSVFSDPGEWSHELDAIPADLAAIKDVANRLVFHYRGGGDWTENGITPDRIRETDTRYASPMFGRVIDLNADIRDPDRSANQRLIGCCRDFTLFFVAMARHKGIPARSRVGFAAYFVPGLYLDHVVAEVWDEMEKRWRLVDAELETGYVDPNDGEVLDPLNLGRDKFVVAPQAWLACRRGEADPEAFLVAPDFEVPGTKSWPYMLHNLVHDVAALNKREMLLWDDWGISAEWESITDEQMSTLDHLAATLVSPDVLLEDVQRIHDRDEFRVPPVVPSFSPENPFPPREVKLRI